VTQATTGTGYVPVPASSSTYVPAGLSPDPTKAVQMVVGPDGQSYPVFTYIIMVKPNGSSGYVKQVTVVVHDPRSTANVLARQSSLFDPNVARSRAVEATDTATAVSVAGLAERLACGGSPCGGLALLRRTAPEDCNQVASQPGC